MTEKRNIHALIEKEAPSLNNLLDPEDVKEFKAMTAELRDTWTKKQVFRTETEMRMSVLQDMKYPTKAAKYWQCVREQNVFLENLMSLSFDCRRKEAKIKWLEKKLETEQDEYKLTKYKISNQYLRGLLFQLYESNGVIKRTEVNKIVKLIPTEERKKLWGMGIKIGRYHIYLPKMLKPKAVEFRIRLWKIFHNLSDKNEIPKSGLNFLVDANLNKSFNI